MGMVRKTSGSHAADEREAAENARPSFGSLLRRHLAHGTRPGGTPSIDGARWRIKEFAGAVGSSERSVRDWCARPGCPLDLRPVLKALFGDDPCVLSEGTQRAAVCLQWSAASNRRASAPATQIALASGATGERDTAPRWVVALKRKTPHLASSWTSPYIVPHRTMRPMTSILLVALSLGWHQFGGRNEYSKPRSE